MYEAVRLLFQSALYSSDLAELEFLLTNRFDLQDFFPFFSMPRKRGIIAGKGDRKYQLEMCSAYDAKER